MLGTETEKKRGQANILDQSIPHECVLFVLCDNVFFSLKTIRKFNLGVGIISENY